MILVQSGLPDKGSVFSLVRISDYSVTMTEWVSDYFVEGGRATIYSVLDLGVVLATSLRSIYGSCPKKYRYCR